jgi:hypothetical protein
MKRRAFLQQEQIAPRMYPTKVRLNGYPKAYFYVVNRNRKVA